MLKYIIFLTQTSYLNNSGSNKVYNAVFAFYDFINKCDVRVEINVPGQTKTYFVSEKLEKQEINDDIFLSGYISSTIRSFFIPPVEHCLILNPIPTCSESKFFFESLIKVLSKGKLQFESENFPATGKNLMIFKILNFFLSKYRFEECLQFLRKISEKDNIYFGIIGYCYNYIGNYNDSLKFLSLKIKEFPYSLSLLFYQAKALLEIQQYDYSLVLAKYLCELEPKASSSWILLAEIYYKTKKFEKALISLDMTPKFVDEFDSLEVPQWNMLNLHNLLNPKEIKSIKLFPKIMFRQIVPDCDESFNKSNSKDDVQYKENEEILNNLLNSLALKLSKSQRKVYNLLTLIEKELGWDNLIEIRNTIFHSDPKIDLQDLSITQKMCYNNIQNGDSNEIIYRAGDRLVHTIFNTNLEENKEELVEKKQININYKIDKNEFKKSINKNQNNKKSKRESFRVNDYLTILFYDLFNYNQWEESEAGGNDNFTNYYWGYIWVHRGMLAERMNRFSMAERAYRRANVKGFSYFAWERLAEIYLNSQNYFACIGCIDQIFEHIQDNYNCKMDIIPIWAEEYLTKIISRIGLKALEELLIQYHMEENEGIQYFIKYIRSNRIPGWDK